MEGIIRGIELHPKCFPSLCRNNSFLWFCTDEFSPYMGRRTSSSLSLTNGAASPRLEPSGSQSVPQRKRLLKAPSLAELDSSDSDVSMNLCVCASVCLDCVGVWFLESCILCREQSKWWLSCFHIPHIQDEIVGRKSASSSSVATSLMDDTSPESALGKKSESGIISASLWQLIRLLD